MEKAKELYNFGFPADECPPYMVIYDTLRRICEEQRDIVDNQVDVTVLSATLRELPNLSEITLTFCQTVEEDDWLESYLPLGMTMIEKSYEHHLRVSLKAIQCARDNGISLHTIHLLQLALPYYFAWDRPDLTTLSESLKQLLGHFKTLRLSVSSSPLELLSHCALNLNQFDMCYLTVSHATLTDFLQPTWNPFALLGFTMFGSPGQMSWKLSYPTYLQICFAAF